MVSLTFIVLTWQLLIVLPLVYSAGSLQYVCGPGSGDTVQIEINKTSNNLAGFALNVLTPSLCKQPIINTSLHYVLVDCQKDTDILIEFTKIEKDHVLRRINERMYNLNCHKDDGPVIRIVTATSFGVTRPSSPSHSIHNFQVTNWLPTITLSVSPSSSVVIGDTLTVTITSTDGKYKHAAQTCRAFSGKESHDLWDSSNCIKGDPNLFGNTQWNQNTTSISHTLEAFRFENSHTLQLECTVMICPTGQDDKCTAAYACAKNKRRRRREATSRTAVVKTTLNVQDFLQDFPNSGAGSFLATSTLIGTAVTIYRALT